MSTSKNHLKLDITDYGAKIDGVTDDGAAWQEAIVNAAKLGGSVVHPGGGVSLVDRPLFNPDLVDIYGYGEAIVKPGPNSLELLTIGTDEPISNPVAITSDAAIGDSTVDVPNSFSKGDIVYIVSDGLVENSNIGLLKGQIATVSSSTPTSIEISPGVYDEYLTAENAVVYTVTTKSDFAIDGLKFLEPDTPTGKVRTLRLAGVRDASITNVTFEGRGIAPISIYACADVRVSGCSITSEIADEFGYGVTLGVAARVTIDSSIFNGCRHAVTTLYDQATRLGSLIGGPIDTAVSNCISNDAKAAGFDEHWGAMRTSWTGCISQGSADAGFQLRGRESTAKSCEAYNNKRQGFILSGSSVNSSVIASVARRNEIGVADRANAKNVRIIGNDLTGNTYSGLALGSDGPIVTGNTIENNGEYGVVDTGSTDALLAHNIIANPASGTQGVSFLNATAPGMKVLNNTIVGYGGGTGAFPTPTAIFQGNESV